MGEARRRTSRVERWLVTSPWRWPPFGSRARCVVALLAMNLLPVVLAVIFHWTPTELMLNYSVETLVVLLVHTAKIVSAGSAHRPGGVMAAALCAPFFLLWFGILWSAQTFAVLAVGAAVEGWELPIPILNLEALLPDLPGFAIGVVGMVLYHATEFRFHWLASGQARLTTPGALMFDPPPRIAVVAFVLIFATPLVFGLGEPLWTIVLLGLGKSVLDLIGPRRRARLAKDMSPTA